MKHLATVADGGDRSSFLRLFESSRYVVGVIQSLHSVSLSVITTIKVNRYRRTVSRGAAYTSCATGPGASLKESDYVSLSVDLRISKKS